MGRDQPGGEAGDPGPPDGRRGAGLTRVSVDLPAVYSPAILETAGEVLAARLPAGAKVLHPFAATGAVHQLDRYLTVGVEIVPELAALHPATLVADATRLPVANSAFDAVRTLPTYANRMADHHEARDGSYRRTYRHLLDRSLHPANSGGMQWGDDYRALHIAVWREVSRVLTLTGVFLLNIQITNGTAVVSRSAPGICRPCRSSSLGCSKASRWTPLATATGRMVPSGNPERATCSLPAARQWPWRRRDGTRIHHDPRAFARPGKCPDRHRGGRI